MKIVVLTTQTLHHTYFIRELIKKYSLSKVLLETKILKAPFSTHHPFEDKREVYERQEIFKGKDLLIADISDTVEVDSINSPESIEYLKELHPEIIVVFGTGIIRKELIRICPKGIINLHGGNPEEYRGLDSHLWAIYHHDFSNIQTTLHRVNETLDDGEVISMKAIPAFKGMSLHMMRRYNTEVCLDLVISALQMYKREGCFKSKHQQKIGRYYSSMPTCLKEICVKRFKKFNELKFKFCF